MSSNRMHFITPADVVKIFEGIRCQAWCYREHKKMKDAYGLIEARHIPNIYQFCEYFNMEEHHVKELLGWTKPKK